MNGHWSGHEREALRMVDQKAGQNYVIVMDSPPRKYPNTELHTCLWVLALDAMTSCALTGPVSILATDFPRVKD